MNSIYWDEPALGGQDISGPDACAIEHLEAVMMERHEVAMEMLADEWRRAEAARIAADAVG